MAGALGLVGASSKALAPALARAQPPGAAGCWAWGPPGVWGPAGAIAWPRPPLGRPQVGAGALWWLDETPALNRWGVDGALHRQRLDALPSTWAPAPGGLGVLAAQGTALQLWGPNGARLHTWPVRDLAGRRRGSASHALPHEARLSLVLAVPSLEEVWEIALDPNAPPLYDGLVHDHRMGEAIARPGHYGVRRLPLREANDHVPQRLHGAEGQAWVYGPVRGGMEVLNLDVRRRLVTLPTDGPLHAWQPQGGWLWLQQGERLQAFDSRRWQAGPSLLLPRDAAELLAAGPQLAVRDTSHALWLGTPTQGWQRHGMARSMALLRTGELVALVPQDARWPADVREIQAVW